VSILSRTLGALRLGSGRTYEPELATRIARIDWFANCGAPLAHLKFSLCVRRVEALHEAEALNVGDDWGDAELEFQNQLTVHLHKHAPSEYQAWNSIVELAKRDIVFPMENERWSPVLQRLGLNRKIVASLQWDILGALMESAYRDIAGRPTFFLALLDVYESGHLPCGWEGRPSVQEGTLLVW
jgi:hypothetical protein